jgi:hypothetical protein
VSFTLWPAGNGRDLPGEVKTAVSEAYNYFTTIHIFQLEVFTSSFLFASLAHGGTPSVDVPASWGCMEYRIILKIFTPARNLPQRDSLF